MYSLRVSLILLFMIFSGAARTVGVKLLYQMGFESPLFVTLLYLIGQSLALLVYNIARLFRGYQYSRLEGDLENVDKEIGDLNHKDDELTTATDGTDDSFMSAESFRLEVGTGGLMVRMGSDDGAKEQQNEKGYDQNPTMLKPGLSMTAATDRTEKTGDQSTTRSLSAAPSPHSKESISSLSTPTSRPPLKRQGSRTGLSEESRQAVAWVQHIPWYCKPVIPALFNLANAAFRWGSIFYVAASTAEMLMSGLELILSVVAARLIRKRQVSRRRWAGVGIVAVGLLVVRLVSTLMKGSNGTSGEDGHEQANTQRDEWIGALLIVGQCLTAVAQDLAEEVFMQEAEFPPTLLLGMEGLFGISFAIPLYFWLAPSFGETPSETWDALTSSSHNKTAYVIGLTCLFAATGICNIMATGATSSMTRNMWKNIRTILVWILGLCIFYATGNEHFGEAWTEASFFVLFGFTIMLSGIYVYYKHT